MTGNDMLVQLQPLMPEVLLAAAALLLLMVGAYSKGRWVVPVILVGAAAAFVGAFYLCMSSAGNTIAFNGMFESNAFTRYAKLLILGSALLSLLIASPWLLREENRQFEFPVIGIFATLGACLLVSAANLISLYMGLELMSLSLYIMAAFARDDVKSSEAGLKYFVLGALASGMLLFGASLVYGFAGTISFTGLSSLFAGSDSPPYLGVTIGMIFVMVGLCFKISAAPFHMWTPDVYEGAPTPVTAFFATVPKVAALAIFSRLLLLPFENLAGQWQQIIIFVSILTMLVGAFGAIRQTNLKRLLAYSSIGHVGYALIGIAAASVAGMDGLLLYLALYVLMSAGTFACLMLLRQQGKESLEVASLAGLSRTRPWLAFALALFMFSMAGIPPLSGFFGKFYVFLAAMQSGMVMLAIVGVLTSVVACYYYLRIVKVMYFEEASQSFDRLPAPSLRWVIAVTATVTFLYFLYPTPLIDATHQAAQSLFSADRRW